ncbi:MAG: DUF3492 domain-containing protein [Solirubrobacterales bacterium]|nr:DUF3492 domain-containing protein [Solirubrobacterales bacterium]
MVDVCLVLENTYPQVTGGVSRWVHDLTTGLPELSFAVAHLHEDGGESAPARYAPPANVAPIVRVGLDPERLGAPPRLLLSCPKRASTTPFRPALRAPSGRPPARLGTAHSCSPSTDSPGSRRALASRAA